MAMNIKGDASIARDLTTQRHTQSKSIGIDGLDVVVAASTLTLDINSQSNIFLQPGVAGQIINLGDATTYLEGKTFYVWNSSGEDVVIEQNDTTDLATGQDTAYMKIVLQDNSTANGTWEIFNSIGGGGGSGTPAAPVNSVQYNDAGAFGGDAQMTWNDITKTLEVGDTATDSAQITGSNIILKDNTDTTHDLSMKPTLINHQSTGLVDGGVLSAVFLSSTYDVTAGEGIIVDNYTDPNNPVYTRVSWAGSTGNAVPDILTRPTSYVWIDTAGALFLTPNLSDTLIRDGIQIGVIIHSPGVIIDTVNATGIAPNDLAMTVSDFYRAIGLINLNGNIFTANAANLEIQKSAGSMFLPGASYKTTKKDPNKTVNGALTPVNFVSTYRDGLGGFEVSAQTTLIDPSLYDDGTVTGGLGPQGVVGNNKWQILRIFLVQNNFVAIQPGQSVPYASLAEAEANILTEPFTRSPELELTALRGYILVRGGATDLSNTGHAKFIEAGKFGGLGSASSSSSTTNLQQAYDNTLVDPEILLAATHGALTLRDAVVPLGANLFEVQSNDGLTDYFKVDANGISTSGNLSVAGNFEVLGTTSTHNVTNLLVEDPLILLGSNNAADLVDLGLIMERGGANNVGMIWDRSASKFKFIETTEDATTAGDITIASLANLCVNTIEATIIDTAFTQGSVVFQGASSLTEDNANFFWDDASNTLGIGTTNPTQSGAVASSFTIQGSDFGDNQPIISLIASGQTRPQIQMLGRDADNAFISFDAYYDVVSGGITKSSDVGSNFRIGKLGDVFTTSWNAGTAIDGTISNADWKPGISLNNSGNVAIGATQASAGIKLDVRDSTNIGTNLTARIYATALVAGNGSGDALLSLTSTGTLADPNIGGDARSLFQLLTSGGAQLVTYSLGARRSDELFVLGRGANLTPGNEAMAFDGFSNSSIGIGVPENAKLTLANNSLGGPQLLFKGAVGHLTTLDGNRLEFGHWNTGTNTFTERMQIAADGKVGIGTVTPARQLDMTGSFQLTKTTDVNLFGVIYKDGLTFIHDYENTTDASNGRNLFIGEGSGNFTLTSPVDSFRASNLMGIGRATLANVTTAYNSVAIGSSALNSLTDGNECFAIGVGSMALLTSGNSNVGLGNGTLAKATTATTCIAIGRNALFQNISGGRNVAIGTSALNQNLGTNNVAIGTSAGLGVTGSNFNYNVLIGDNIATKLTTGSSNVILGRASASELNSGGFNIIAGALAGATLTTGSSNILIGYNTQTSSATSSSELNIGNTIYGDLVTKIVTMQDLVLTGLPIHADEAAAVVAGLPTNTVYKTATGELRIKL